MNSSASPSTKGVLEFDVQSLHGACFYGLLLACYFLPPEAYSLLFLLFLLVAPRGFIGLRVEFLRAPLMPIVLLFVLGSLSAFANLGANIARDVWVMLKIVVCFSMGCWFAVNARSYWDVARILTNFGVLSAVFFLIPFLIGIRELGFGGEGDGKQASLGSLMAIPFLMSSAWRTGWMSNRGARWAALLVVFLSLTVALSRTSIACGLLMVLCGLGFFDNFRRILKFSLIIGFLIFVVVQLLPDLDAANISFAGKLGNSLAEIAFTDAADSREMLINWRGFEAFRALLGFESAGAFQQIVGQGLGATVDLGMEVEMSSEMTYQYLPVLHNGYMQVLTKFGILGVLAYLFFIFKILKDGSAMFGVWRQGLIPRITIAYAVILIYTSLVVTGAFNKTVMDPVMIIFGAFYGSWFVERAKFNVPCGLRCG